MSDPNDVERLDRAVGKLWVEQQAYHIILNQLIGGLAKTPLLAPAIKEAFEQSLSIAQSLSESPPDKDNSRMGVEVLRVIEDLRATIFGVEPTQQVRGLH